MNSPTSSIELESLKSRRHELVKAKNEFVAELQQVKSSLKLPAQEHVRKMQLKRQAELVSALARADAEFVQINGRMRTLNVILSNGIQPPAECVDGGQSSSSPIRELAALRDEYASFAADKTRVSSMRAMAAQFALELTPIIRALIAGRQ